MIYDPETNTMRSNPKPENFIPSPENEAEALSVIHGFADQLGIDQTLFEVAAFMAFTIPHYAAPYTSKDFPLICSSNILYLQQLGPFTMLIDTPEKRAEILAKLSPKDLEQLRTNDFMLEYEFEELCNDPAPSMFRFLSAFQIIQLIDWLLMQLTTASIYRTKAQAGEAIHDIPNQLAVPTMQNYQYVMSLKAAGNAYLQPLASTDGLKFSDGKMYFRGNDMQPVSEVELQNMVTNEGIDSIDLGMLRIFYSIILTEFEKTKHSQIRDVITLYIPDLAESMGLQRNINKAGIQRLIDTVQSFHNIVGVMHGTRNGKPSQSLYPVLNFEGYDDKRNTISFSSPYMNMVIETVYKLAIRMKKNGEPKLTKRGEPVRMPTHSFLIKTSIVKERNKAAVENVMLIVQLIEQCGKNTPHISAATIIERNPAFEKRLNEAKNKTTLLKRTFETTWRILREQTILQEKYPDITLPDPNDPAMIPTLKNLDSIVFTFAHSGKGNAAAAEDEEDE